jgi:hypothetical protein
MHVATGGAEFIVDEFSGLLAASPLHSFSSGNGNAAAMATGASGAVSSGELAYAAFAYATATSTFTPGVGWTTSQTVVATTTNVRSLSSEYLNGTAAGTVTATATQAAVHGYAAALGIYRPVAATAGVQAIGLITPTGQTYSMLAIEIQSV